MVVTPTRSTTPGKRRTLSNDGDAESFHLSFRKSSNPIDFEVDEPTQQNDKNPSGNNPDQFHASFDLSAILYKRRGGLGWNVEHNWVPRLFTLYGSVLCYYESSDLKSADPSRPRNRIDLSKEETLADMHIKQKNGAPSDFMITLNLYPPLGAKKKWEICCKTREEQEQWYEALRRFDGKPEEHFRVSPSQKKHFKGYKGQLPAIPHSKGSSDADDFVYDIAQQNGILSIPFATFTDSDQRDKNVFISFGILNASLFIMRFGSVGAFWISLMIANLVVSYLCAHMTEVGLKRKELFYESGKEICNQENNGIASKSPESHRKVFEAGSTFDRAQPKSTELQEIIKEYGPKSITAVKAFAATTTDFEELPHTYWNVDSSKFNLRIGPNYKKNKQKAPSASALYDLHSMDLVNSQSNLGPVDTGFEIPDIEGVTDVPTGHAFVPPMIVLVVNIPSGEPSMFQSSNSGPSYVAVLYLVISDKTRKELKDLESASPAVKLLAKWCEHAETDDAWKGRFKFMAYFDDVETLGLPSFITGFNGKPVLISKSGKFTRHEKFIEMSVNVHAWAFIARKGLYTLLPRFPDFIINIGATIEGRNDEEQPECLLGGVRTIRINLDKITLDGSQ